MKPVASQKRAARALAVLGLALSGASPLLPPPEGLDPGVVDPAAQEPAAQETAAYVLEGLSEGDRQLEESSLAESALRLPRRTGYAAPSASLDDGTLRCIPAEYVAAYDARTAALLAVARHGAVMPLVVERVGAAVRALAMVGGVVAACNNGPQVLLPGVDGLTWQATADDAALGFAQLVSPELLRAAKKVLSNLKARATGFQILADALNRQDLNHVEDLVTLLARGQRVPRPSTDLDGFGAGLDIFERLAEHAQLPEDTRGDLESILGREELDGGPESGGAEPGGDDQRADAELGGGDQQIGDGPRRLPPSGPLPADYGVAMTPEVQQAAEKLAAFNQTVLRLKPSAPSFAAVQLLYGCDKAYHNELLSPDPALAELAAAIPALAAAHDVFDRLAVEVIAGLGRQRTVRERAIPSLDQEPVQASQARSVSPEHLQRYWYTCVLSNLGARIYEQHPSLAVGRPDRAPNRYIKCFWATEAIRNWICPRSRQPVRDYHVLRAFAAAEELKKYRSEWYKFKAGFNVSYPTRDFFGNASDQTAAAVAMICHPSKYVVNVSNHSEPKWILWEDHPHYTTQDTSDLVIIKQKSAPRKEDEEWERYLERTLPLDRTARRYTNEKPKIRVI
ncbi:hypothetical protein GNI_089270 [Gregarina niphandrodes]|uniref:Transmembrane protein n=1 Tax=Gregarina niphandrodes TaxID=110365 RepID=A0A023B5J4_GRENI|nr:hypothetical protein GNI_089270 [Gregarina niphandrodes]EZG61124.1 hypothetical protein GNI_089270 [Gregarina niphandrodes]|eukprot:XP_011130777.1 hypothetical protein GNI_089270 [Gregarina niphandrodes]